MRIKHKSLFKYVLMLVLGITLSLPTVSVVNSFLNVNHIAYADDDKDQNKDDYSFYHLASSAATYYNGTQNPDLGVKFEEGAGKSNVNMNDAGGMLGYADPQYDKKNWIGSVVAGLSNSATRFTYNNFRTGELQGLYHYAMYGRALAAMGLDSTAQQGAFNDIMRFLAGGLIMIAYTFAVSVPFIFKAVGTLLTWLNPFQFFVAAGNDAISGHYANWFNQASQNGNPLQQNIASMAQSIVGVYQAAQQIGLFFTVPLLLMVTVAMWLLLNNVNKGTGFKRGIMRALIIVMGVPLLADLYTSTLDDFTKTASQDPAANVILASTFTDFQGWASNNRLAMPKGDKIVITPNGQGGEVQDSSTGVRQLSRDINRISNNGLLVKGQVTDTDNDIWNSTNADQNGSQAGVGFSMLGRYIGGIRYTAPDYETQYKSKLDSSGGKNSQRAKKLRGIKYLTDPEKFSKDKKAYFSTQNDPGDVKKNGEVSFVHNGLPNSLTVSQKGNSAADISNNTMTFTGNGDSADKNTNGLSSLALYNYLTSTFDSSGVTVYSSNKATSSFVMEQHHAVNLVGTGFLSFGYYINALVLFAAIALIGWGYAIGLLSSLLVHEFSMLLHMPLAMMGALSSASKMITAVFIIILQIFVTMFLYSLATDFLMMLNLGTSSALSNTNIFGTNNGSMILTPIIGAKLASQSLGTVIYLIISTLLTVFFAFIALKARGTFIKTMGQVIGQNMDKLLMTGNYNPSYKPGGSQPSTASDMGAAMTNPESGLAAGMEAGNKADGSNGAKGSDGKNGQGGTKNAESGSSPTSSTNNVNNSSENYDDNKNNTVEGAEQQNIPDASDNPNGLSEVNGESGSGGSNPETTEENNGDNLSTENNKHEGGLSNSAVNGNSHDEKTDNKQEQNADNGQTHNLQADQGQNHNINTDQSKNDSNNRDLEADQKTDNKQEQNADNGQTHNLQADQGQNHNINTDQSKNDSNNRDLEADQSQNQDLNTDQSNNEQNENQHTAENGQTNGETGTDNPNADPNSTKDLQADKTQDGVETGGSGGKDAVPNNVVPLFGGSQTNNKQDGSKELHADNSNQHTAENNQNAGSKNQQNAQNRKDGDKHTGVNNQHSQHNNKNVHGEQSNKKDLKPQNAQHKNNANKELHGQKAKGLQSGNGRGVKAAVRHAGGTVASSKVGSKALTSKGGSKALNKAMQSRIPTVRAAAILAQNKATGQNIKRSNMTGDVANNRKMSDKELKSVASQRQVNFRQGKKDLRADRKAYAKNAMKMAGSGVASVGRKALALGYMANGADRNTVHNVAKGNFGSAYSAFRQSAQSIKKDKLAVKANAKNSVNDVKFDNQAAMYNRGEVDTKLGGQFASSSAAQFYQNYSAEQAGNLNSASDYNNQAVERSQMAQRTHTLEKNSRVNGGQNTSVNS